MSYPIDVMGLPATASTFEALQRRLTLESKEHVTDSSPTPGAPPANTAQTCGGVSAITVGAGQRPANENSLPSKQVNQTRALDPESFPNPPARSSRSGPRSTLPNVAHLLQAYGITARYNVIKKKLALSVPGHFGSPDNFDSVALTKIESLAILNGMDTGRIAQSIEAIADANLYNPVADWISAQPWDGSDRFGDLCATVTAEENFPADFKRCLIRRWAISAVAAAFMPSGFSCRGVLVLQGAQGIGKTKWAAALVSDPALSAQVVKLAHHLDAGDKDSQLSAIAHWIVEIGELDGSLRKDIARLKGFLTADQDKIRRPYGKTSCEYPRRTVFCATVNDANFLVDVTGNSRWWTVPVVALQHDHGIDMQQFWAQAKCMFDAGEQWWLTTDEEQQLSFLNRDHCTQSVIRELLQDRIDFATAGSPSVRPRTCSEILGALGYPRPTNPQFKDCAQVLRELVGKESRINGNAKWRVALIPPAIGHDLSGDSDTDLF